MPTAVTTYSDFITAGTELLTDFGLLPVVMASAVIGVAFVLMRRAKSAAR
jgi:hypothetical protein